MHIKFRLNVPHICRIKRALPFVILLSWELLRALACIRYECINALSVCSPATCRFVNITSLHRATCVFSVLLFRTVQCTYAKNTYLTQRSDCGVTTRRVILPKYSMPYLTSVESKHTETISVLSVWIEIKKDYLLIPLWALNFFKFYCLIWQILYWSPHVHTYIIVFPIISQL